MDTMKRFPVSVTREFVYRSTITENGSELHSILESENFERVFRFSLSAMRDELGSIKSRSNRSDYQCFTSQIEVGCVLTECYLDGSSYSEFLSIRRIACITISLYFQAITRYNDGKSMYVSRTAGGES